MTPQQGCIPSSCHPGKPFSPHQGGHIVRHISQNSSSHQNQVRIWALLPRASPSPPAAGERQVPTAPHCPGD